MLCPTFKRSYRISVKTLITMKKSYTEDQTRTYLRKNISEEVLQPIGLEKLI